MPDVREHIRNSRPEPDTLAPLDVDQLVRRGRRRTAATRGVTALTVVAVVAGGAVAIGAVQSATSPTIEPGGLATQPGSAPDQDGTADGERPGDSLSDAVDHLIAANRQAPAHPVPGPGEILIERTYAIWGTEVVWYEQRIPDEGPGEIIRAPLGTVEPTTDLASLRQEAASFFEAGDPESEPLELPTGEPAAGADRALDEAEQDSQGAAEPTDGSTERPDQMHAFMRAADALRTGLQPEDRIRALQAIARLDSSIVEYRGTQQDLLGREGIAIAGRDGTDDRATWNVLIFDPETGDFLGEYDERHTPDSSMPLITTYTARETVVLDTAAD